jgi:hypothetical protein
MLVYEKGDSLDIDGNGITHCGANQEAKSGKL